MKPVRKTNTGVLTPKRGAIPTPKEEIDRATPYVPEEDQTDSRAGKASRTSEDDKNQSKKHKDC
jgi:hypothetical protein